MHCLVHCIALSFMNLTALEAKSDIWWMPQAGFYRVVKHFNVGTIRIKSPQTIHFCCRSIRDSFEEKIKLLHLFFGSAWLITESELKLKAIPMFAFVLVFVYHPMLENIGILFSYHSETVARRI